MRTVAAEFAGIEVAELKKPKESIYWQQIPPKWHAGITAQWKKAILDPRAWIDVGERLMKASAHLRVPVDAYWEHFEERFEEGYQPEGRTELPPTDEYYMLVGFAAENFLKALLVLRNRRDSELQVENSLKLPLGHGIASLARSLGFSLTEDEEQVLHFLEWKVRWSGRYPVPLEPSHVGLSGHAKKWIEKTWTLVQRFREEAEEAIRLSRAPAKS